VELIVVDDASEDNSVQLIEQAKKEHDFKFISNDENLGNCTSFNRGFAVSSGRYLIDLAADDRLLPDRIEIGCKHLEQLDNSYGVHYCDVNLVGANGTSLGTHFKRDKNGALADSAPSGDVYQQLVERYFICAPSMMIRREVLEELGGYDENLSYEDFDFWVRSARRFKYIFSNDILVERTILRNSLSAQQLLKKNIHAISTAQVCEKILKINVKAEENTALLHRINYELKWALITENWEASQQYIELKDRFSQATVRSNIEKLILKIKPPWYPMWRQLLEIHYRRK